MDKYNCDLFEVSCISMINPDDIYPYMEKTVKRLSIANRAKLVRLGTLITDIFDTVKYSSRELVLLEVLGMTLMSPEQLKEVAGIPEESVDKLYNGEHIEIGDLNLEALYFVRNRYPDLEQLREDTRQYLSKAMGIKKRTDERNKKEAATVFTARIQDLLQCYQPVEQQKILEELEETVSAKDAMIKELQSSIDGLMKQLSERDADIARLRQDLHDVVKDSYKTDSSDSKEESNLQELIYQKDLRIEELTERLRKRTESLGGVHELYAGELDYILTDVITQYIQNNPKRQRRKDILEEFLQKSVTTDVKATQNSMKDVVQAITATRDMSNNTPCIKAGPFTLDLVSSNNHHKYIINGDERYAVTIAITPSDYRAGEEAVKYFMREFT